MDNETHAQKGKEQEKAHEKTQHKAESVHKSPAEWFKSKGWSENPFTFNIYPYLFVGYKEQTSRIMLMLLEKHKFVLLTGPTGSGKTTLLRWVAENLENGYETVYIGKPPEKAEDFVIIFNEKFNDSWFRRLFRKGLKNTYQIPDFLNRRLKNRHLVLMIDEIHEANIETLEWLRVLGDQVNGVSFIFAGLPVFEQQLMDRLETLRKRIAAKVDLSSLTKEEAEEMIRKRIKHAGGRGDEFSKELIDFIHSRTGGFPREILRLCDELVNAAIMNGSAEITKELLEGVEEMKEERVSMDVLEQFTPMQKGIVEILSQKALSPGQIADALNLEKYKSRQHAVRSANNILKMLLAEGYVERRQSEKTFVYSLTPKIRSLLVRA